MTQVHKYLKLFKNTLILGLGNFGAKTITFLMIPVYTRFLSKEDYGQLDIISTTVMLLMPLFSAQIFQFILRFTLNKKENKSTIFTNSLLILTSGILLSMILIPFLFKFPVFENFIIYFYLMLIFNISLEFLKSFTRGLEKIFAFSIGGIIYSLLIVIFNIYFLIYLNLKLSGYFLSIVLSQAITTVYFIIIVKPHIYLNITSLNSSFIRRIFVYSIPIIPNVMCWWIMNVSDRYLLKYFIGLGATGIYAIAYKIPTIINLLSSIFYQSWQISAIEEYDKGEKSNFYTNIFNCNFIIFTLLICIIMIGLKPLMSVWVSKEFYTAWLYMPFLLIGMVFCSLSTFYGVIYLATQRTIGAFTTSVAGAILNIVLNIILIPRWGIQAAAFSTMAAYFLMWILRIIHTKKYATISLNYYTIVPTVSLLFIQAYMLYKPYSLFLQPFFLLFILIINFKTIKSVAQTLVNVKNKYVRKP